MSCSLAGFMQGSLYLFAGDCGTTGLAMCVTPMNSLAEDVFEMLKKMVGEAAWLGMGGDTPKIPIEAVH